MAPTRRGILMMNMQIRMFVRQWTLAISMIAGISSYFILRWLPLGNDAHSLMLQGVHIVQPILIFLMLFLTFCRVHPSQLRLSRWQIWNLLLQTGMFLLLCLLLIIFPETSFRVEIEGALLCFICPTATAAVVVTSKLGGRAGTTTTYTLLINLCVAILVPLLVPAVHPQQGMTFTHAFCVVLSKVFPLLLCPIFAAELLRRISPSITSRLASYKDLPFHLWAIALALALAVTTRSLINSQVSVGVAAGVAVASLLACIIQFGMGRMAGSKYGDPISAAQSCGQKNTVFAIWMGYTFLTPVTSLAGGFYSIWHNVYNSWQLAQMKKKNTDAGAK